MGGFHERSISTPRSSDRGIRWVRTRRPDRPKACGRSHTTPTVDANPKRSALAGWLPGAMRFSPGPDSQPPTDAGSQAAVRHLGAAPLTFVNHRPLSAGQVSVAARCVRSYGHSSTCCGVDYRTYTIARRVQRQSCTSDHLKPSRPHRQIPARHCSPNLRPSREPMSVVTDRTGAATMRLLSVSVRRHDKSGRCVVASRAFDSDAETGMFRANYPLRHQPPNARPYCTKAFLWIGKKGVAVAAPPGGHFLASLGSCRPLLRRDVIRYLDR